MRWNASAALARASVLLGAALVAAIPGRAQGDEAAEPLRVAVVPVVVARHEAPSEALLAGAVTAAVRRRLGLAVLSEEERFAASGADLSERVLDCGADARCVAHALERLGAPLGVVVVVNLELGAPLLGVQLIDCAAGRVVAESIGSFERAGALAEVVEARTEEVLTRAGRPPQARLVVHVRPPDAALAVLAVRPGAGEVGGEGGGAAARRDPEALGPASYTLAPGVWRVRAEAPGRDAVEREVVLAAGTSEQLDLELAAEPSVLASPWLWIAIGAVVLVGGTGAVLLATRHTERYACVSVPGAGCEP